LICGRLLDTRQALAQRDTKLPFFCRHPDHRIRTTLAVSNGSESVQVLRQNGQYVALLRFVAPDLGRRHPGLFQMDLGQFKNGAAARIVDELGKRVRKPACPDVVDSNNGALFALLPATINDLLGTALDLGLPALNRLKIQLGAVGTYTRPRRRTSHHANSHARPARLT